MINDRKDSVRTNSTLKQGIQSTNSGKCMAWDLGLQEDTRVDRTCFSGHASFRLVVLRLPRFLDLEHGHRARHR